MNHRFFSLPSLAAVFAAINRQGCRWVALLNKRKYVAVVFINGHAAALKTGLGDSNLRPPDIAAVAAAPGDNAVRSPSGDQRAIHRDDDVGETLVFENLLKLDRRLTEERLELRFAGTPAKRQRTTGRNANGCH